jgi:tetratricopeptide (TPR) repeat protein
VPMARAFVMMGLLSEDSLRPALHAQLLIRSNLLPAALGVRALRLCQQRGISLEDAMEVIGWRLNVGRRYELSTLLSTHDQLLEAERTLAPDDTEIGALCLRLADLFETYERYADAEPLYKRALSIMDKHSDTQESLTEILERLAWVYVKQQKFVLSEAIYHKTLELRINMFTAESEEVARSYMNIGRMQTIRGDHADAVIWFQKALPLAEQFCGEKSPQVAELTEQLAIGFYELGAHKRAEPLFWKAFKLKSTYLERTSYEIVSLLTKLAEMYSKDGQYTMADSVLVLFNEDEQITI